jgi:hypothetical protein
MQPKTEQRWKELCAQASVELDHEKLLALVAEINKLLTEEYAEQKSFSAAA